MAHFDPKKHRKRLRKLAPALDRTVRHVAQVIAGILADFEEEVHRENVRAVLEEHKDGIINGLFYRGQYTVDFPDPDEPQTEPCLGQLVFMYMRTIWPTIRVGALPKQNGVLLAGGSKKDFPYKGGGH
jgi:hypothetical protein